MEEQIIKCPCGQENHLVVSPEGLRYKLEKHGNGELCRGLCFNCRKPLAQLEVKQAQVVDETVDDAVDDAVDDSVELLEKKNRRQLHELAEQLQIDVPANLGKKKLIKRIEEFLAANAKAAGNGTED